VVLVCLLIAAGGLIGAADARAGTTIRSVRPVDASRVLLPGYRVTTNHVGGVCSATSRIARFVYRCRASTSLDPCWAELNGSVAAVVCMGAPWRKDVRRLVIDATTLPPLKTGGTPRDWGYRLRDGRKCNLLVAGATKTFHGAPIRYGCPGGRFLIGSARTTKPNWSIRMIKVSGGKTSLIGRATIATVWRARR
jgi:hypothetical protein